MYQQNLVGEDKCSLKFYASLKGLFTGQTKTQNSMFCNGHQCVSGINTADGLSKLFYKVWDNFEIIASGI